MNDDPAASYSPRGRFSSPSLASMPGLTARTLADRILRLQVEMLKALFADVDAVIQDPPNGSPARVDLDYMNAHGRSADLLALRWWAHRGAMLNLSSAEEHLEGLRTVLASPALRPLPAMALGRSVYEAVIQTCWLLDADVSTGQRIARWAARLLHDTQEPPRALASLGDELSVHAEADDLVEARGLGQQLLGSAGFELRAKGGDRSDDTANVTFDGHVSSLVPNVSQLVERFTPNQTGLWTLFSGAVHCRGWLVAGLEGDEITLMTSVVAPLLDTSDALAIEVCRYFGLDPRPTVERTHRHRVALLEHARPNKFPALGVDGYRAAGGAPALP